jgi:hypothetical protein
LYLLLLTYMTSFAVQSAAPLVQPPEDRMKAPLLGQKAAQLLYPTPLPEQTRLTNGLVVCVVETSNVIVSPNCGAVEEAPVTVVTTKGPVIEEDGALPPNAVPADTREAAIVVATAILLNTGVLLSVRLRTGANETVLSEDRHELRS